MSFPFAFPAISIIAKFEVDRQETYLPVNQREIDDSEQDIIEGHHVGGTVPDAGGLVLSTIDVHANLPVIRGREPDGGRVLIVCLDVDVGHAVIEVRDADGEPALELSLDLGGAHGHEVGCHASSPFACLQIWYSIPMSKSLGEHCGKWPLIDRHLDYRGEI